MNVDMTTDAKKLTQHLAKLSNLPLSAEQLDKYTGDLKSIMTYMDQIKELKLKTDEETSRVLEEENIWREDEVKPSLSQADSLNNAHKTHDGFFVVPRIIEKDD